LPANSILDELHSNNTIALKTRQGTSLPVAREHTIEATKEDVDIESQLESEGSVEREKTLKPHFWTLVY
jgi:hypothetical protein